MKLECRAENILAASPKLYLAFDYASMSQRAELMRTLLEAEILVDGDPISDQHTLRETKTFKRASKGVWSHIAITPVMLLRSILQLDWYFAEPRNLRRDHAKCACWRV